MLTISKGLLVVQNIVKKTFDSILKIIKFIFAFFLYEFTRDMTITTLYTATWRRHVVIAQKGSPQAESRARRNLYLQLLLIDETTLAQCKRKKKAREKDRKAVPRSRSHVFPPVSAICYTNNCLDHPRLDPFKDRIKLSNPQYDNSRMHCAK